MLLHFLLVDFFLVLLISADQNRVVLNPFKDYRPSARRYIYINASLITVEYIEAFKIHMRYLKLYFCMWFWPYRNCSFLQTSSSENISRFIATTQSPLPHTYEDFWEMIIQHHCPVIVMLTWLVDNYEVMHCINFKVSILLPSHVWQLWKWLWCLISEDAAGYPCIFLFRISLCVWVWVG
jgi:hypothetical protein